LAYNAPHSPLQAPKKYLDRFSNIKNQKRRTYAAMISAVDDGLGRILDKLKEHDLDEHTLVVFLSDNGGPDSNGSLNTPLRGEKGSPYEGGIRVPFAMRWTGALPAGVDYVFPVISLDIFATIVSQAHATLPANKVLDGVDLVPYLNGQNPDRPHDSLFWRMHRKDLLITRRENDKLIRKGDIQDIYDLSTDISESKNLIEEKGGLAKDLTVQVKQWERELKPPAFPGLDSWPKK
jgi:arylsulfatase A-like enzyme